jgi:hypothetical protein
VNDPGTIDNRLDATEFLYRVGESSTHLVLGRNVTLKKERFITTLGDPFDDSFATFLLNIYESNAGTLCGK